MLNRALEPFLRRRRDYEPQKLPPVPRPVELGPDTWGVLVPLRMLTASDLYSNFYVLLLMGFVPTIDIFEGVSFDLSLFLNVIS